MALTEIYLFRGDDFVGLDHLILASSRSAVVVTDESTIWATITIMVAIRSTFVPRAIPLSIGMALIAARFGAIVVARSAISIAIAELRTRPGIGAVAFGAAVVAAEIFASTPIAAVLRMTFNASASLWAAVVRTTDIAIGTLEAAVITAEVVTPRFGTAIMWTVSITTELPRAAAPITAVVPAVVVAAEGFRSTATIFWTAIIAVRRSGTTVVTAIGIFTRSGASRSTVFEVSTTTFAARIRSSRSTTVLVTELRTGKLFLRNFAVVVFVESAERGGGTVDFRGIEFAVLVFVEQGDERRYPRALWLGGGIGGVLSHGGQGEGAGCHEGQENRLGRFHVQSCCLFCELLALADMNAADSRQLC